jgi:hypothetical protein
MSENVRANPELFGDHRNRPDPRRLARPMTACTALLVGLVVGAGTLSLAAAEPKAKPAEKPQTAEKTLDAEKALPAGGPKKPAKKKDPYAWKTLFDGKTLKGWKVPVFGGDGEVTVKDGTIVLGMGDPMTGITWAGKDLPKEDYELVLEAKRTEGIDFFATTTFPVGKNPKGEEQHVSFVVGGWAGTVVGISCVDYYDAADNITTQFKTFEDKKWYKIRIRVSEPKIECWIDEDKMVDLLRKGRKFDTRIEVDLNKPLGIASYMTEGVLRNIRLRRLKPEEIAKIKKEAKKEQERVY